MAIAKMETRSLKNVARTPYGAPKTKSVVVKETDASISKEVNRPASLNQSEQQALLPKPKKSTTDVSRAIKISGKRSIAEKNNLTAQIPTFQHGVTLTRVPEVSLMLNARSAITNLIVRKSSKLGIPMPPQFEEAISLYSENFRQLEQAKFYDRYSTHISNQVKHDYKTCGSRDGFDWLCDEGLSILLPIIAESKGWVIFEQEIVGPVTPAIAEGIFRLRNAAKKAGVCVMLFLVCKDGYEKSGLKDACDDYIEIAPCEPDAEHETAFSIDCVGIRHMNALGIGKVMCRVRLSNGVFRRSYTPFVSSCLETRVMWNLRGQGKTLDEIGKILKKNKTSVLRRLKDLPKPTRVKLRDGWLERYLESFAVVSRTEDDEVSGMIS